MAETAMWMQIWKAECLSLDEVNYLDATQIPENHLSFCEHTGFLNIVASYGVRI